MQPPLRWLFFLRQKDYCVFQFRLPSLLYPWITGIKKCIHIDISDKNNVGEIKNHIFVKINLIL